MSAAGRNVDWRAVSRPEPPSPTPCDSGDVSRVHAEMEDVVSVLVPDETLPFALAGCVPETTAAVAAYAESYRMGMSTRVRPLLFEALWMHGLDLGDASQVHALLSDVWRNAPCPDDRRRVGGSPAEQLVEQWRAERAALGPGTVIVGPRTCSSVC